MPSTDAATRIQRTPVPKYIGASLEGEREPAETEHRRSHLGTVPSSLQKRGGEAAPGCPLPAAWGPMPWSCLEGAHRHTCKGSGQLQPCTYPYRRPQPCTRAMLCPGDSSARLSHAGTPKQPEVVPSFPEARYGPKCKPPGVTTCSRLAEPFTFPRTMLCIP